MFRLTPDQAGEDGLVCGGRMQVFIEPIETTRPQPRDFMPGSTASMPKFAEPSTFSGTSKRGGDVPERVADLHDVFIRMVIGERHGFADALHDRAAVFGN